jgi:ribosome maturation factor RimP
MSPAGADRSAAHAREHLLETLRPVVAATGYELDDVSVTSAGRRSLVRVSVDAEGGIDLDGVAVVSRAVSDALDAHDQGFAGPYVLEVSSPGVDRPLTEPRHWRRAAGRLVAVPVGGVLLEVDDQRREFGWPELGRGQVQVEFTRPAEDTEAREDPL